MTTIGGDVKYDDAEVAAHRARWVDALRDGGYWQARETLRMVHRDILVETDAFVIGYCCLGVAENERGCVWEFENATTFRIDEPSGDGNDYVLGQLTVNGQRWLGLTEVDPIVTFYGVDGIWTYQYLSVLNDSGEFDDEFDDDDDFDAATTPWDLDDVADVIELQPPDWDGTLDYATQLVERLRRASRARDR